MMNTSRIRKVEDFTPNDLYEVLSGVYPDTAAKIRENLLKKIRIVFGDDAGDLISGHFLRVECADRVVSYEKLHFFVGDFFGENDLSILEKENKSMENAREEAVKINSQAKDIASLTGKSLGETIDFLLHNVDRREISSQLDLAKQISDLTGKSFSDSVAFILQTEPKNENIEKSPDPIEADVKKSGLSETDRTYIVDYVLGGKNEEEKKGRRDEMVAKYGLSRRKIWGIILGSCKGSTLKDKNEKEDIDKLFSDYIVEFFGGKIISPEKSGITFMDMHDCFCRDTLKEIELDKVQQIWAEMLKKSPIEDRVFLEGKLSVSTYNTRQELFPRRFVTDRSGMVLLQGEVKEKMDLER